MIAFQKAGWDVWGIEPSASFVRFGVERLGISPSQLLQQSFEDTDLPDNMFDLVWFSSVLEHLVSPAAALRTACRIVKPGGIIHVGVPSSSAFMSRILNFYYRLSGTTYVTNISPMHPPFHLYEFTHKSFIANGERLGYDVARYQYWAWEQFNVPASIQPLLRRFLLATNLGDGLIVSLRKR